MTENAINIESREFEQGYSAVRKKEGRVYSDAEVFQLPEIRKGHPHYKEWQIRNESCTRLKNYLKRKSSPLKILELGCGNGWLSHKLSELAGVSVTGVDINRAELDQASRVFADIPGLYFVYGNLFSFERNAERFDVILFAASLQYFSSLEQTLGHSLQLLNPGGEIHILDTHFYSPAELKTARQRTIEYYSQLGFAYMANHYFHHGIQELENFPHRFLYKPSTFHFFFHRNSNPFPWICIKTKQD